MQTSVTFRPCGSCNVTIGGDGDVEVIALLEDVVVDSVMVKVPSDSTVYVCTAGEEVDMLGDSLTVIVVVDVIV